MEVREAESLATHTTLALGGKATLFAEISSEEELKAAVSLARDRGLPLVVIGGGSNLLVPDEGVRALVVHLAMRNITIEGETLLADAGARWDDVVDAATAHGLWGIENLAGIPGTMGGAAVQNIGAYGAELSETFSYALVLDTETGETERIAREDARFAYRMSVFKESRRYVILRVALALRAEGQARKDYKDLRAAHEEGVPLTTPEEVARAVRAIRAGKFPDLSLEGSAGSFFKNPVLSAEEADALVRAYPEVPHFPQADGTVKVALAWLLDKVLSLKGFAHGAARLYEKQPLVIVTRRGATAHDVDTLARDVATRVHDATGITLEREVETFTA